MDQAISTKSNKDKFLCYCSRVTHKKFRNELYSQDYKNLESLCSTLKLASQCAACLPNIEDEFFNLKGKKSGLNNANFFSRKYSIKEKINEVLDYISGDTLISQKGYLPMLVSKFIKTWLIISNEKPSLIKADITNFSVKLIIYNNSGNIVKKVNQLVKTNQSYQICLNKYVPLPKEEMETYYVKLYRSPMNKGFRGSTRPHFFYETTNSMSTLHLQDGERKINFINLPVSKNEDRNMLFIINPSEKTSLITPKLQTTFKGKLEKEVKIKNLKIPSKGSKILDLNDINDTNKKYLIKCESTARVKCYFIIADKKYQNISVDHI